jgi:hypothetical protein
VTVVKAQAQTRVQRLTSSLRAAEMESREESKK